MRDIVERAMHGDREAFGVLVGQTLDRLYAIATRVLRDTDLAEDAVQAAYVQAYTHLASFEGVVRRIETSPMPGRRVRCCAARNTRSRSSNKRLWRVVGGRYVIIRGCGIAREVGRNAGKPVPRALDKGGSIL